MGTQGVPYSQEILTISRKDQETFFFYSEGVLLLEFMPHKTNITGCTYASTMVALRENIKLKSRGKLSAGLLMLHYNAPTHKLRTSWAAIRKYDFVEINQLPCSPDLAPSDYFLFRNLKKFLHGQQFLGTQMMICFWNSCHTRQPLMKTPMLPQWWLYARISNRNSVESCRLVSCCFMTCTRTQVTNNAGCCKEMWLHRA